MRMNKPPAFLHVKLCDLDEVRVASRLLVFHDHAGSPDRVIRSFRVDYLPEHGLIVDEDRPTYEICYKDTLEYCVPIHRGSTEINGDENIRPG